MSRDFEMVAESDIDYLLRNKATSMDLTKGRVGWVGVCCLVKVRIARAFVSERTEQFLMVCLCCLAPDLSVIVFFAVPCILPPIGCCHRVVSGAAAAARRGSLGLN